MVKAIRKPIVSALFGLFMAATSIGAVQKVRTGSVVAHAEAASTACDICIAAAGYAAANCVWGCGAAAVTPITAGACLAGCAAVGAAGVYACNRTACQDAVSDSGGGPDYDAGSGYGASDYGYFG